MPLGFWVIDDNFTIIYIIWSKLVIRTESIGYSCKYPDTS